MSSSKKITAKKGNAKGKRAKAKAEKPKAAPASAAQAEPKRKADGKMSGLDAAAKVLAEAEKPLKAKVIVDLMLSKGLWQTAGKTPAATIYSAIFREIRQKGDAARFKMVGRGNFALNK